MSSISLSLSTCTLWRVGKVKQEKILYRLAIKRAWTFWPRSCCPFLRPRLLADPTYGVPAWDKDEWYVRGPLSPFTSFKKFAWRTNSWTLGCLQNLHKGSSPLFLARLPYNFIQVCNLKSKLRLFKRVLTPVEFTLSPSSFHWIELEDVKWKEKWTEISLNALQPQSFFTPATWIEQLCDSREAEQECTNTITFLNIVLTWEEEALLSKSPNFPSSTGHLDKFAIVRNLDHLTRNLRLRKYFHEPEECPAFIFPFVSKTHWCQNAHKYKYFHMYTEAAVREVIKVYSQCHPVCPSFSTSERNSLCSLESRRDILMKPGG